eukprot:319203-Rhodomonas_salina.1
MMLPSPVPSLPPSLPPGWKLTRGHAGRGPQPLPPLQTPSLLPRRCPGHVPVPSESASTEFVGTRSVPGHTVTASERGFQVDTPGAGAPLGPARARPTGTLRTLCAASQSPLPGTSFPRTSRRRD